MSPPVTGFWVGLHDNISDRPSTKVAPVGCQLVTMALKIQTVTVPKGGLHVRSCHPIWDISTCAELWHETGGLSATLAVNRLGRCCATWPRWFSHCPWNEEVAGLNPGLGRNHLPLGPRVGGSVYSPLDETQLWMEGLQPHQPHSVISGLLTCFIITQVNRRCSEEKKGSKPLLSRLLFSDDL